MGSLYNLIIRIAAAFTLLAASVNSKARRLTKGHEKLFESLEENLKGGSGPIVWFHCASLGEFEQARPLIERIKSSYSNYRVLLTFFSPSGYEVRRKYDKADVVSYLPWDTTSNVERFIQLVNPAVAIFIKYEFWFNFSRQLRASNVPLISVASIFRRRQIYFRWYGGFFRKTLNYFSTFFAQDDESASLLTSIGISDVHRCGDTRFDRVFEIHRAARVVPLAESFKGMQKLMVVGSSWPEDLEVIIPFINKHQYQLKFIIAPHEITENMLRGIEKRLEVLSFRFSTPPPNPEETQVLLVDNIGMLANLYRYGEYAFVGGAYGKGLHNILEAACQGIPVFFGDKNFTKFKEATDLISRGGAFTIKDAADLTARYEMISSPEFYLPACEATRYYVEENLGASDMIMAHLRNILS